MDREFHRIRRLPPYLFAEMKARARAAGEDIAGDSGRRVAAGGR